ncbi:MAG TPA: hypothetical protein VFS05_06895 [Gemmatimonadaceae bacterium]|nr:hypothetical protein [Gemmatimonadaceae bacterium]
MTISLRAAMAGALAFSLLACAKSEQSAAGTEAAAGAPAASSGDSDLQDITSFELTMSRVDKLYAAIRNIGLATKDLPPEQREAVTMDANDDSIDDYVKKLESQPVVRKAIRDAGLSPREFALTTMALVQAGMAGAVLEMRPNDNQDSLVREMKASMANIRFVREHKDELQAKQKAMQEEMKRLGVSDDDGEESES